MITPEQPAFPYTTDAAEAWSGKDSYCCGLTKREYFAAMAMQGLIINQAAVKSPSLASSYAIQSLNLADALIQELNK